MPTDPKRARKRTSPVPARCDSSTEFAVRVLRAAAELHRASRDHQYWPSAFSAFRSLIACSEEFPQAPDKHDDPERFIEECIAQISQCRHPDSRGCWTDHPDAAAQEQLCLLLVDHLGIALDNTRKSRQDDRQAGATAALDAFARPLIVFDENQLVVHANHAGHAEMAARRWIAIDGMLLRVVPKWMERQFAEHFGRLRADRRAKSTHLRLPLPDGVVADVCLRRLLRREDSPSLFLLSQTVVEASQTTRKQATGADVEGLDNATPRQRELARLLLSGATLTDAAARMGISRATANGHLKGLFAISQTGRQTELIAWLTRAIHL